MPNSAASCSEQLHDLLASAKDTKGRDGRRVAEGILLFLSGTHAPDTFLIAKKRLFLKR